MRIATDREQQLSPNTDPSVAVDFIRVTRAFGVDECICDACMVEPAIERAATIDGGLNKQRPQILQSFRDDVGFKVGRSALTSVSNQHQVHQVQPVNSAAICFFLCCIWQQTESPSVLSVTLIEQNMQCQRVLSAHRNVLGIGFTIALFITRLNSK